MQLPLRHAARFRSRPVQAEVLVVDVVHHGEHDCGDEQGKPSLSSLPPLLPSQSPPVMTARSVTIKFMPSATMTCRTIVVGLVASSANP